MNLNKPNAIFLRQWAAYQFEIQTIAKGLWIVETKLLRMQFTTARWRMHGTFVASLMIHIEIYSNTVMACSTQSLKINRSDLQDICFRLKARYNAECVTGSASQSWSVRRKKLCDRKHSFNFLHSKMTCFLIFHLLSNFLYKNVPILIK